MIFLDYQYTYIHYPNPYKIYDWISCFNVAFYSFKRVQLQEWSGRITNQARNFDWPNGYASFSIHLNEFDRIYKASL